MEGRNANILHYKFVAWKQKENELAVLTLHAYADVALPKKFDTIFEMDNPGNFINIDFEISQAVIDGFAAIDHLSHGHKHVGILTFQDGLPPIMRLLNPLTIFGSRKGKTFFLGFCLHTDFEEVKKGLASNHAKNHLPGDDFRAE